MAQLEVVEICKQEGDISILMSISFSQQPLQKIAIAGESGAGKSTLLKIIAGLIQPDSGHVLFEGKRILGPYEKLLPGHPSVAYLSQSFELRNNYVVDEILNFENKLPLVEAENLYEICQVAHLLKRRTDQLSGGEKQRIALARLLISMPKLLLLDEPFSNLDPIHKQTLKSVIKDIGDKLGITCILVSHDPLDTLSWADKILVMKDGKIIQDGTPEEMYRQPVDEYVAGLFGKYNLLTSVQASALLINADAHERVFVRPDDFFISSANRLTGIVKQTHFFGSYYYLDVWVLDASITLQTKEKNINVGDEIKLNFTANQPWVINQQL